MVTIILILVLIVMLALSMYNHGKFGALNIVFCFVIFFMFMYQKMGHDYYEEKYVVLANEHGIKLEAVTEQEVLKNYKIQQFEKSLEEN